jgi:hypothetical protein
MTEIIAPKRRRLSDLYLVGKELEFNDDSGEEPIKVWLSKISPIEQRDAADQATKVRAKILSIKNAPTAETDRLLYQDQFNDLGLEDREEIVAFVAGAKIQEAMTSNEHRIASEDSWSKDNYLRSLQDAWNDGLSDAWIKDPEGDPEAARVYSELKRFATEVEEATAQERENIVAEYEHTPTDQLIREAIDKIIDTEADFAWLNEFSYYQVFYAVRDIDDHKVRYFESVDEVKTIDNRIVAQIVSEYRDMTVEGVEGKV